MHDSGIKKQQQYIIAYIDILGGSDLIKKEQGDETLNKIYQIFDHIKLESYWNTFCEPGQCVKFFSDNFIIARKYDGSESILKKFLKLIARIQFLFLVRGLYVRGGIDIGQFYIDETFVWGKVLLSAYELESKEARFPRILLSQNVASKINLINDLSSFVLWSKKLISIDFDGKMFVDYFDFEGDDGGRFPSLLQQIKDNIIENLNNATNESVREKIKWIIEKYNEECARTKRKGFMIDIALKGV